MLKINRLRTEILTNKSEDITDLYGFDFSFDQGMNIVAGPNSKGKTTINTCIYYALGLEELLGGHNEKALDKALKEAFTIKLDEGNEEATFRVSSSKVILEIENENNEVVCLERYIKSSTSKEKTSNITVHYSIIGDTEDKPTLKEVYFVNARGNNEDPNGFYHWLSDFINIQLPKVSNNSRSDKYSPLYLQTIFSAIFIEQTKGWSDFFATMPFFGITKAKEKIVEFILGLNEIELSTERDILNKEKRTIIEDWRSKIKSFSHLEKQTNSVIKNVPEELTTDNSEINEINVFFSTSEEEEIKLNDFVTRKSKAVEELENRPLSTVKKNRESAILEYNEQKEEYFKLKNHINRFESKLRIEKQQIESLRRQLRIVQSEIKDHINLQKVFDTNIINERGTNRCPTCSQEVTTNLISSKNIQIPQLTLEENTNFLRSQKKVIESSLQSLKKTTSEKEILRLYFKNSLRRKEILIKSLSKDLIADDRAFSESEVVKKIQLEREIENLKWLKESVEELKNELKELANNYHRNNIKINELGESAKEDELQITNFETQYLDYLFRFDYESNAKYQISINRKEPFKYFPVYKRNKNDTIPQSIRINSSASDFVRNIWAYTLGLLNVGVNHPGVIIFDEPGQHRTNLSSLKELFMVSSTMKDKQIIIFTSVNTSLHNEENEKIELDVLTEDLEDSDYKLIKLDDNHKVIGKLNSTN